MKPIGPFINYSLIAGWVIALVFLWGGWKANQYASNSENELNAIRKPTKDVIDRIVKNEVERIAGQAPVIIDSQTILASASYINGEAFFIYQLHTIDADQIDKGLFASKMMELTKNNFCTDPKTELYRGLAKNIQFNWKYIDSKGKVVTNLSMKGAECGQP